MQSDLFDRRPVVLLILLTILVYWQVAFSTQFSFMDAPDQAYQVMPWYQMQARAWNDGYFPMWDPYVWSGQSLLGQMQPGAAFPFNWPLFAAPLQDGYISLQYIHWHYVAMHVLAALFMYALVRDLGRSRYASLVAGLAFACTGYMGGVHWPQMLHGAIWLPLIFLLFHRLAAARDRLQTVTYAALCGGAVGMALLSGHHQTPIFTLLALTALCLYFIYGRMQESFPGAARFAGLYVVVAVFAFLVAALQLLPAVEYGRLAYRWVGATEPVTIEDPVPYYVQYESRFNPVTVLGMVIPYAQFIVSPFVGFFCLSMAVYAVSRCWKERWVKVYAGLGLAALVYSFGPLAGLHGWIYSLVPYIDKARTPAHALFIFQFALFVVAAYGIDHFLSATGEDEASGRWVTRIQTVLLGFAAIAFILLLYQYVNQEMAATPGDHVMTAGLVAVALAALLGAHRKGVMSSPAIRMSLLLLMVFEISTTKWLEFRHREDPKRDHFLTKLTEHSGVMEFLRSQPRPFRFETHREPQDVNLGAWEGVEAVDGYLASVSRDLFDFYGQKEWHIAPLMLNTVFTVAKEKTRDNQIEVYSGPSGWKVFRNPDAYPRAWIEHDIANIAAPSGSSRVLPQAERCEGDESVLFKRLTLHRVLADVRLACRGYVIFADPYFPGWTAVIDGEPTPIFRAHGALRGLAVPPGRHTVEFVYRPTSVYLGGALTALGLLSCGVLAGIALLRRTWP